MLGQTILFDCKPQSTFTATNQQLAKGQQADHVPHRKQTYHCPNNGAPDITLD